VRTVFQEGQHREWIASDPILEPRRHSERCGAIGQGGILRVGRSWGVLPAGEREYEVLGGVCRAEVMDVRVMKRESGWTETENERPEERRQGGWCVSRGRAMGSEADKESE
jgi:hypothetical protein